MYFFSILTFSLILMEFPQIFSFLPEILWSQFWIPLCIPSLWISLPFNPSLMPVEPYRDFSPTSPTYPCGTHSLRTLSPYLLSNWKSRPCHYNHSSAGILNSFALFNNFPRNHRTASVRLFALFEMLMQMSVIGEKHAVILTIVPLNLKGFTWAFSVRIILCFLCSFIIPFPL